MEQYDDARGELRVLQHGRGVPFLIQRVFWLSSSDDKSRGNHSHHKTRMVMVAISGQCRVDVDGIDCLLTSEAGKGLLLEPWEHRTLHKFTKNCKIMVLASTTFDADDYIQGYKLTQSQAINVEMVPMFKPGPIPKTQFLQACERVYDSGTFLLGKETALFEEEFAQTLGCQTFAVSCSSGTTALTLGLVGLGIGSIGGGSWMDEVMVVGNAGVPVVSAIVNSGARPFFLDVDTSTWLLELDQLEKKYRPTVKAIIVVHLYGLMARVEEVVEWAKIKNVAVLEDCAQAFGSQREGKFAGTFGHVGCFSFYPTKNLGGFGDSGMIVGPRTDDKLRWKLLQLRQYGWDATRSASIVGGMNARMDELQAALLRVQLKLLSKDRIHIASLYRNHLEGIPFLQLQSTDSSHSYHLFVVRVADPAGFIANMSKRGVMVARHYPIPVYAMPAFAEFNQSCPVADKLCSTVVSLPLFPGMSMQQVLKVIDSVKQSLQGARAISEL